MVRESIWKILVLSGALVLAMSCAVMYSLMKGGNGVSGDSEGEAINTTYATESAGDTNKTNQTKTNRATIPLEKPPFID